MLDVPRWIDLVVDDYFPTSQAESYQEWVKEHDPPLCEARNHLCRCSCFCEQVSEGFTDGQTIRFSRGGNLCYLGVRSHTVFCQVVTHVVLS